MGYWQPGTQYNHGDVVTYEGNDYKIIQPHRSQGDWTPPVTPALWGRMQKESGGGGYGGFDNADCHSGSGGYQPQQPQHHQAPAPAPAQPQQPQQHYQAPPPQYSNDEKPHGSSGHESSDDEGGKKSDSKKWLGIGGGIAAGAAILGAGFAAYKHGKNKEEDEAEENKWLTEAQRRTDDFWRSGPRGPATWVLNRGKNIPQGAIVVGQEHSWTLYICRAFHKGSITPGKASDAFKKGAVIGYAHDEIHKDTYEILLGDMNALEWVPTSGRLDVRALGRRPVDGGHDTDGSPLYVVRAMHKGIYQPGKAGEKLKAAFIPFGGDEEEIEKYEVLCYN